MALDAGTGSVRAVLFDFSGAQIGCAAREWEHLTDPRFPGSMDFDWEKNWGLAKECIKGVLAETNAAASEIAAISTTCMREGFLLYDAAGKEIWACANVDSRANDEVAALVQKDPALEKEIYSESGEAYALGALPRLLWVKNKLPEIYEKAEKFGMFNDWLIYKLTWRMPVEPSNGSTTGIFSLNTRNWDPAIAQRLGLKTNLFGEVLECGQIAASVSKDAAAETGLAEGTPVVVGGGDTQLGCIGVGAVSPGQAAVFGGSFWQYEYNTDSPKTDAECRVRVNCHAVPGVWQYEALAFNPGLVMRWFRDAFCQHETLLAKQTGEDPYDLMNKEAEKVPAGCNGMMCAFSDVMNFTSWKHASPTFMNFSIDPALHNRYTFYRSILENTALVTKGHIDLVEEATGNKPSELIFASGAAKSPLWCQIVADVTGLPVKVPVVKEATALGAAILAGVGIGLYKDAAEGAEKCVQFEKTYQPDEANHLVYEEMYPVWRKAYAAQLKLADEGLEKHMWKAPGI
ncbi:MAG: autoinducer-2 kinase [Lachnospiraceae bacterium]|nr:autoinducer-2 kinase [Lachnospiraceae bacterium]